jgi:hypothetical protein
MEIREYRADDLPTLSAWHEARHSTPFPAAILPPLGFVVEQGAQPIAALFCYQSFGVGVAFIDIALSRPGLSLAHARRAFFMCLSAIILACADTHKIFRAFPHPAIARILKTMGFSAVSDNPTENLYLYAS